MSANSSYAWRAIPGNSTLAPRQGLAQKEKGPVINRAFLVRPRCGERQRALPATAAATTATAATAAVATATTAAAAEAATRTTATATGAGTILRFIDAQRATAHRVAVEGLNGASCVILTHFNKAETARTTGITIDRKSDRSHFAVLSKQRADCRFISGKRQIAYINFCHLWKHSLTN